jgi:peptide methionine sulfoxide reductase msrA/msrB
MEDACARKNDMKEIYLAGGCFWGTEKYLSLVSGVLTTEVGYANGATPNPSYKDVCSGSGHAEVVRVEYDEKVLPLSELLEIYYESINPTAYCFWLKYFNAYTHSVVRRIDEHAVKNITEE